VTRFADTQFAFYRHVGEVLRRTRKEQGVGPTGVALSVGISERTLHSIERGVPTSVHVYLRLTAALGLSIEALIP
jgi:predicted transcriptional regulator